MEYLSALKKSVVAGLMIGIGCTVFLNMDNSIVASFLFGLGLFTIINLELNLFTGKIGYICKENCAETLITLVGNGIGVNIMAFLMKQTRVGVDVAEMDITDSEAVEKVMTEVQPDKVVHCAAWTAVDAAEDNQEVCHKVNVDGTANIDRKSVV